MCLGWTGLEVSLPEGRQQMTNFGEGLQGGSWGLKENCWIRTCALNV